MNNQHWQNIKTQAEQWVREAGERIRISLASPLTVETKSNPNDLVTNMDKATEQFFVSRIRDTYHDHKIMGEEGFGDEFKDLNGTVWIIDPIDGTMNFVHQQRHFTISVGIYHDGVGQIGLIYDVMANEMYSALRGEGAETEGTPLHIDDKIGLEKALIGLNANWLTTNKHLHADALHFLVSDARGIRSYGSAALEIAYVTAGRLNAYATLRLSPWDYAGGLVIAQEAGAVATTLQGEPLDLLSRQSVLIAAPRVHEEIVQRLKIT
ncbi:inositol monophosphatase family protein [Bacillaceae bacterium SIJ1]|uniref:inositol monophosphatase family protein n=1 Tax=Litoribacterium kuwaitense TaxID=1398745 RepID=UPI0013EE06E4|nr:inositol monophosphatase family protein [Litoribacterium kuwaitense]NGP44391.1 inositol monophosphatase family protein [Litoribacterium kuwaitense]